MKNIIQLGDLEIEVTRKAIKNVHLSVHPPDGRVSISAPLNTRLEVVRAYAISKLAWIRLQQDKLVKQPREKQRQYINRESHYLWGRRYLLNVVLTNGKQHVTIDHKRIYLFVRPRSNREKREEVFYEWQKELLHEFVAGTIEKWQPILRIKVSAYFLQKMKTKWGSCNHNSRTIRLNTELVKKPKDLVEYVIVHEMAHIVVPNHSQRFKNIVEKHFPNWQELRLELNDLPLGHTNWKDL